MAEKKKFIEVEVPVLNREFSALGTPKELNKRTIKLDLSRRLKGKGVLLTLQVFEKENKLTAYPKKIELLKSYLQRIIRKRTDNVEDSFSAACLDLRVNIKPFLITRKRVSRAVRKNLRNTAREFLINYVKEKKYIDICEEILNGVLQKELLPKLKKVYPLAFCDVRVFETKELEKLDFRKISSSIENADIKEPKETKREELKENNIESKTEIKKKKKADKEGLKGEEDAIKE